MNDIKEEIDILFKNIKEDALYKKYQSSINQLRCNEEIIDIINEIKRLQKIYVNTKDKHILNKVEELQEKLYKYPLYEAFIETKEELSNQLNIIKEIFDKYFEKILNIK